MQELRLLFAPAEGDLYRVSLTDGLGARIGIETTFAPFLTDADYENLRWYLEEYMELPDGGAVVRAERIEGELQAWGRRLHDAVFSPPENQHQLELLCKAAEPRELTIATSDPALLRLPWELMADARGSLALRVSVRRQLDVAVTPVAHQVKLPLRILYIVSRPEDAGFIDPRLTTQSLFAALDPLGANVQLDFCRPPTLARMGEMLRGAQQAGDDYHVVHFDGHGTYMPEMQIGALCFEKADDGGGDSKTDLIPADQLGELLAQHNIPLVVLEACRSATVGKTLVFRSVAPRLIQAGVGSVLSMGHAVHVAAAQILLDRFYRELVCGTTIGHAVAQGRSALVATPARWLEYGPGARTLKLQDWFLPHLYQRGADDALLPGNCPGAAASGFDPFALSRSKGERIKNNDDASSLPVQQPVRRFNLFRKVLGWFLPHLHRRSASEALLPGNSPGADASGIVFDPFALSRSKGERIKNDAGYDASSQPVRLFDLFLSHNHNDAARIESLARTLTQMHGLRIWLDKWECRTGRLEPQCETGIRNSRFTVVAGSQAALNSKWVDWEIKKHLEFNPDADRLLPVKFEELQLPPHLDELLWVDFTDPAQDTENAAHLAELIRSADAEDARRRRGFRPPAQRNEHGPFPPPPNYGFHGRARELLLLERRFRTTRGIVLHAMGGMGKTALATEAAQWWTRSGLFRDGACFVSFERFTNAERVVQVLGCYLMGDKFNQFPATEQRRRAIEEFRQKNVLMVWDNFESALAQFNADSSSPYTDEERHLLADLFRDLTTGTGNGCLLITCRPDDTKLPGAARIELRGLARADSLWLLAEILKRHDLKLSDPRLSRVKLDPLLDDLADHPLSLELVAPHLRTLTPEAIRVDFAKLLTQFHQAAPEDRNTSLLASLEFSRRHLSAAAREALPWLGLFSGGVFEDLLLEVSQLTPEAWESICRELQRIALVRVENDILIADRPFLRFHPTLAAAVVDGTLARQPETRQRYILAYLSLRQMLNKMLNGSQSHAALEILDREEANYRRAVHWAISDGLIREAATLGNTFKVYLEMSGRLRERDAWVTLLKEATRQGGFTNEAANYEREHAWTRFQQGDPQGAVEQLRTLIARLRSTTEFDAAFQLALAVGGLGRLLHVCGAAGQAIPILREAIVLCEVLVEKAGGEPWEQLLAASDHEQATTQLGNLSATMGDLANALSDAGRHDEALEVAEKALKIDEQCGDQCGVAAGHGLCAQILMAVGRFDEADARYDLALAAARMAGDRVLEGTTLQHQGRLAAERRQFARAADLYQQALQRFQAAGNQASMMLTYNLLGVVELNSGRLQEAGAWYQKSRQLAMELKAQISLGAAAQNIGIVFQEEGEAAREQRDEHTAKLKFQAALDSVQESLRIQQALGNQPFEAASFNQLAQIHLLLGDLTAAEHHAQAARRINEPLGLKEVWRNYAILSDIAAARGDSAAAAAWAQKRDTKRAELERLASGGR